MNCPLSRSWSGRWPHYRILMLPMLLVTGCETPDPTASELTILVQVQGRPAELRTLQISAALDGKPAAQNLVITSGLDKFAVKLPLATQGKLDIIATGFSDGQCQVARGKSTVVLDSNTTADRTLTLPLTYAPELCAIKSLRGYGKPLEPTRDCPVGAADKFTFLYQDLLPQKMCSDCKCISRCDSQVTAYASNLCGAGSEQETISLSSTDPPCHAFTKADYNFYYGIPTITASCVQDPAVKPHPVSTWSREKKFCSFVTEVDGGSACSNLGCVLETLNHSGCLILDGDNACPETFPVKANWYTGFTDSRDCPCPCGQTTATCNPTTNDVLFYDYNNCSNHVLNTQPPFSCSKLSMHLGQTISSLSFQIKPSPADCPLISAAAASDVLPTPTGLVTACCTP